MIVLKASQERVLAALQAVAGIVERRHTLPILANVLIRKTGEQIELTASDLDTQVRTRVALGADAGDFATTVSARKLIDILRAMPAEQLVTLAASANKLTLQGGRSRFTLQTLPPEDFPLVVQAADLGPAFSVPQSVLKGLIEQVEFAMAVQDIRYFLNGVLFIAEGKTLRLVATDGNRLALAESTVDVEMPKQQVILPRKAVHELQRHLRERSVRRDDQAAEPSVEMRFSASQARFSLNGTEFITKLIEGRFPDFDRVIPKRNPHAVTLGRAPFLESLQRASILTSERFRGIRVSLAPGALRIASSNAEREEADEDLEIDYGGDSIEIGFNVTYLLDVLGKTDVDMVKMELQDASSSVLFTFPDRAGFKYVVSPMRL